MVPLQGQALTTFQEKLYFIWYIIIDEMSFIGQNILQQIDARLRQAFPGHNQIPFGVGSIILFGDLAKIPPVKDIPMYASQSYGKTLWLSFSKVITLIKIFCENGEDPAQIHFRSLLSNLRNAEPTIIDWEALMSRTSSNLMCNSLQYIWRTTSNINTPLRRPKSDVIFKFMDRSSSC